MSPEGPFVFFNTTGQLSRQAFVVHLMLWALGSFLALALARVLLMLLPFEATPLLFSVWLFLTAYSLAALCAQRLNHLQCSRWWMALVVVPVLGTLPLTWGLLCFNRS